MAPTIRIDDEVYAWLQSQARPFDDTPNSVLRRLARLGDEVHKSDRAATRRPAARARLGREVQTPQTAFRAPILKVLKQSRGDGHRLSVLRDVEKLMSTRLTQHDKSDIDSGGPRWQKSAEWEVRVMREKGLLKPVIETPRGVWALTEMGRKAADDL